MWCVKRSAGVDGGRTGWHGSHRSKPAPSATLFVFYFDTATALTTLTLHWPDEAATTAFAQQLAAQLLPALRQGASLQVQLRGDLGAGKTTFTRHLLHAMGVEGRIKSPSYGVVEAYEVNGLHLWHFDFYRFADPREWEDAGFRDIFAAPGLCVVEWPDKVGNLLPPADVSLLLETQGDESRVVRIEALRSGQERTR